MLLPNLPAGNVGKLIASSSGSIMGSDRTVKRKIAGGDLKEGDSLYLLNATTSWKWDSNSDVFRTADATKAAGFYDKLSADPAATDDAMTLSISDGSWSTEDFSTATTTPALASRPPRAQA